MDTICKDPVRPTLVQCVMEMIARYLEQYKACMKGKRYALFQQHWFEHTHEYFQTTEEPSEQSKLWTNVVKRAEQRGTGLSVSEQRIVVSTLSYSIHDLMASKVQEHKAQQVMSASTSNNTDAKASQTISESNVALYRYGGFALHSMMEKRKCHITRANAKNELELLNTLKVRKEEWDGLPPAIQQLTRVGLDIQSPTLLPLLCKIVEKTFSLVNEKVSRKRGRQMIEHAKQQLDDCSEVKEAFDNVVPPTFSTESKTSVLTELVHKVFMHELTNAAEEIELEQEGKAVKLTRV